MGLGRRRLNIPLINVCESLRKHCSVLGAANDLHCSEGYIFGVLKANRLKLKGVIGGKATLPDTIHLEHILLNKWDGKASCGSSR